MENIFKILKNDLTIIDIETSGLDIKKDRIIQIGMVKYQVDGNITEYKRNFKVDIEISEEANEIHSITNELLEYEKYFSETYGEVLEFIGDSDLGGYNLINFDLPFLFEEFSRVGIKFPFFKRKILDIYKILNKFKPRTLEAVYQRWFGSDFHSHDALNDSKASMIYMT